MKKLILRYLKISIIDDVSFKIEEQTHRNDDFADNYPNFDAKNGVVVASDGYPAVYNQRELSFYCRGRYCESDDKEITVNDLIWKEIKIAVKEYNEHYGYYGECILGETIENIIQMEMFIID